MPCLNLSTNVDLSGVDVSSIHSEATAAVASLLGRTEDQVMVVLKGSVSITFGGSDDPAAHGELMSIGGLTPDVNKHLSAAIATILEAKLSVPRDLTVVGMAPPAKNILSTFYCDEFGNHLQMNDEEHFY